MVFYDPREATKVYNHLRIKPVRFQGEVDEVFLHCRPINKQEVEAVSHLRLETICLVQSNDQAMRGYPEGDKVFENSESKIIVEIIQGRPVAKETIQVSPLRHLVRKLSDLVRASLSRWVKS